MEPPKKRKENQATTADGARYNKRQRPDNYSALLSQHPPPRPVPSPSTETIPPHAHRADWSQLARNSAAGKEDEATTEQTAATLRNVDTARDNEQDKGSGGEGPGSPIDEPATHFGDFTPMRTTKPDEAGHKKKKGKDNEQHRDLFYGQYSALPGLDSAATAKNGDPEALAYLQQVRNEANGLPSTFRRPTTDDTLDLYDTGRGDMRGRYSEGAYFAAAPRMIGPVMPPGYKTARDDEPVGDRESFEYEESFEGSYADNKWVDAQEAYHNRLLLRFNSFRELLGNGPPASKKKSLDKSNWVEFPLHNPNQMRKAVRHWLSAFEQPPLPAQIAQMNSYCVLKLLDIIKRKLECFKDVEESISIWIFALLARLSEIIPIYCDDASIAREMALRALMVRVTFTGEHIAELEDKVPHYYAEDKEFFEHVDTDPKRAKKEQKKKEKIEHDAPSEPAVYKESAAVHKESATVHKESATVHKESAECAEVDDLKAMLNEQKELIMRKNALLERVDGLPRYLSKGEAFGLAPLSAEERRQLEGSDSEDEVEKEVEKEAEVEKEVEQEAEEQVENEQVEAAEHDHPKNPNANTRTTIDMILSVACDVFGQKDLSKYREVWGDYDYVDPSPEEQALLDSRVSSTSYSRPPSRHDLPEMLSPICSPELVSCGFTPEPSPGLFD